MSGSSATSTLDIILRDDVSPAAKAIAASIEKVEAEAKQLDAALSKSGTRSNFQARLKSLGASKEQIEGAAKAWKDYAAAEGLAMEKAGEWTAKQAAQAKNWENVAIAKLRADRGVERAQEFAAVAQAKRSEELREREAKRQVDEAAKTAKAVAAARERVAEMEARDERRRQETAARDATRLAATEARDRRRATEQEAHDEQQRVERRMRDDRMLAERRVRDEQRAAEAAHRHEEMLAHKREHAIERQGFRHFVLSSAAMAVSAHAIAHTGEQAWEHGAELQHERIGLRNAGRSPEEVAEIERAGRDVLANTPTASMVESMKVVAETTAAFGSVHHAIENLPFMMKAMSILKTAGGDNIHGDAASIGQAFAKTFEERQTRPEEFVAEATAMIPAMVATGGVFNPEQLYAFAQQAKSALPSLSMRFLSKIAPSLIGAQGGERAGTALNAFENVISGKANDKKQAQEWMSLGLLDPKGVIMKNGQATSWRSGAVKDTRLAMTDPLEWAEKYLIPALKAKGVDTEDREAVKMVLDTMFRNQNANFFASEITQAASRARLHKDEALFSQTGQFDELYKRNLQDFGVASGALRQALGNLAAAATAPMMHVAANGLVFLAKRLNELAELAFAHPNYAAGGAVIAGGAAMAGAGWMSYQLMNGFGLGTSAKALDAAAAHLMAVGGGPGGFGGRLPGAIVPAGGGVTGVVAVPAAVELGAALAAGGLAVGATALVKAAFDAQQPGNGGQWAPATAKTYAEDQSRLQDQRDEADRLKAQIDRNKRLEKLPGSSDTLNIPLQQQLDEKLNQIESLRRSLVDVEAANSHEARVGRAMMAMPKPEEFGPNLPPEPPDREAEHGRGYMGLRRPEEFGPDLPRDRPWAPPPVDHSFDGVVMGQLTPKIDTSGIDAASAKATEAGATMQTALNVTASPKVETGSIDAANAAVQRLLGSLAQVGASAAAAGAAVAAIGGAGARPGPSLASRMRGGFTGNGSGIG